ncbi:MAG TPA: AI-2E family transporter [Micromonosporaceae bacterium]|nr:AI-2E family transporter [Micromonosporaceae bacterium]
MNAAEHRPEAGREPLARRGAWARIPLSLRVGALASGCLLVIAAGVYVVALVAMRLASLSIAIAASILMAALLEPVVRGLQRLRVPRALGSLVAVLLLVAAFVVPAVLLWNIVASQFGDVAGQVGDGLRRTRVVLGDVLPISDDQLNRVLDDLQERLQRVGMNALAGALTLVEVLAAVSLALFVAFFLLKDGSAMWAWLLHQLPERARGAAAEAGHAGWETVTRYIRGTLIVAAIDAVGIGIALAVIRVPFALPLALLVFVGGFVPYVGATVSGSVAVLIALAANGPVDALLVLAAVVAVQQIEGNLLEPLIVGRQVRLHPVAVVVVVFAGSLTAGIAGAVVAVPLTAVAYRVARVLQERRARERRARERDGRATA